MLPITHDGYTLRPGCAQDAEAYYSQNYCPLDPELARLTGCKPVFTREEVVGFFLRGIADEERRWLLLIAPDGRIAGESLLTEIDPQTRSANFRIALFSPTLRGRGLGTWMTRETLRLAFDRLHLHRVYLDVFSFNPRAERAYLAAGFTREGVLRDAIRDGDGYADDILMSILEDEWRAKEAGEGA